MRGGDPGGSPQRVYKGGPMRPKGGGVEQESLPFSASQSPDLATRFGAPGAYSGDGAGFRGPGRIRLPILKSELYMSSTPALGFRAGPAFGLWALLFPPPPGDLWRMICRVAPGTD